MHGTEVGRSNNFAEAAATLAVAIAASIVVVAFTPETARASETYTFHRPWPNAISCAEEKTAELGGDGASHCYLDDGAVQVFQAVACGGRVKVKRYLRFMIDPEAELGGAGEYEIRVRFKQLSSEYGFGFLDMDCTKAIACLHVQYDLGREKSDDYELISAEETVTESAVGCFLDEVGLLTASTAVAAVGKTYDNIVARETLQDLMDDMQTSLLSGYELKTSFEVRYPVNYIVVWLGAEVTGGGFGVLHLSGAFVLVEFEEVVIEKVRDITPAAQLEIVSPAEDSLIYTDQAPQMPIKIRIRDESGKTNKFRVSTHLTWRPDGHASDERTIYLDVPEKEWRTEQLCTVSLAQIDPNQHSEKGYVEIAALYEADPGYFTATARSDFKARTCRPPITPVFTAGTDTAGFELTWVHFEVNSADPDTGDVIYYQFSWGDGQSTDWLGPCASGHRESSDHMYDRPGNFPVKVRAKDQRGMLSQWSEVYTIAIANLPGLSVSAAVVPNTDYWGSTFNLRLRADDPGEDHVRFRINWGDGTEPFWTAYYASGERVTLVHTYDDTVGLSHIRVKAQDQYGDTAVKARDVMVLPLPPFIRVAVADSDSVSLEWSTTAGQKTLAGASVIYVLYPGLDNPVEVPVPISPSYETTYTLHGLLTNTLYYVRVKETYASRGDTMLAESLWELVWTTPYSPRVEFLAPTQDTLEATVAIQWHASDPDPGDSANMDIRIHYSLNGGFWGSIGPYFDGVNDGIHLWNTLNDSDGVYVIRIIGSDAVGWADTAFSETLVVDNPDRPSATVVSPVGGVRWSRSHEIRWEATDKDGHPLSIDIQSSRDWGQTWDYIALDEPNDSSFSWNTEYHADGVGYQIRVIATDPDGLSAEALSGYFIVDNTPPQPVGFSSVIPLWDAQNPQRYCIDLEWPSAADLSPPVRYHVYWGPSDTTINLVTPVRTTKFTSCTLVGLPSPPSRSCFFIIGAEDSADLANDTLNTDAHCVYFTHTGPPSDNALTGLANQSNGVVTGTDPNYQFNGSVVVIPGDVLNVTNATCVFSDTTGSSCIKVYGQLKASGSMFRGQSPGDWRGIVFEDSSKDYAGGPGCSMSMCTVKHAVDGIASLSSQQLIGDCDIYSNSHAGINCYESDATITGSRIYDNPYGIYCELEGKIPPFYRIEVLDNDIHDNSISGTHFDSGARPAIIGNMIHANSDGSTWDGLACPYLNSFHHNDIYGNLHFGVVNYDVAHQTCIATYNWWGHATGPSGVGPGRGDSVSTGVAYLPFLTSAVKAPVIDWGNLEGPTMITLPAGGTTEAIYGRVHEEGVTEGPGQGGGIQAELGYGADGSAPWEGGWEWFDGFYSGDQDTCDEYLSWINVYAHGDYDYCYRYSMNGGQTWVYADHDGNDTGSGGTNDYSTSEAGDLTVGTNATILLVDDDLGSWTEELFTEALDANAFNYDLWNVDSLGSPSLANLDEHEIVIWTTGAAGAGQTLSQNDEDNLMEYFDLGGRLFLSSQGYLDGKSVGESLPRHYLHLVDWQTDVGTSEVQGIAGDPITDGMYSYLAYPFANGSDSITVDASACPIFLDFGTGGCTALRYPEQGPSYYKVVFLAFPFDAIDPAETRATLMAAIIEWLKTPCVPVLYSPPDSSVLMANTTQFEWSSAAGVGGRYTLQYALDSVFTHQVIAVESITDSSYNLPAATPLSDNTTYYWRVKATNAAGDEGEFQPHPFVLIVDYMPDVPFLVSPPDLAAVNDPTPELVWSSTAGPSGSYVLEYATDSTFTHDVATVSGLPGTAYTVTDPLADGTYYWHVRARSGMGYSSAYQSHPFMFNLDTEVPARPTLLVPEDLAGIADPTPGFVWNPTAGPGGSYTLEYAADSSFTSGVVTVAGLAETTYTVTGPLSDAVYYWHVEAIDKAGNHSGYQIHPYSFVLDTQAPGVPLLVFPQDLSTIAECKPQFVWGATAGDRGTYTLQYALDSAFTYGISIIHDLAETTHTVAYPSPALLDTAYFWRVKAIDVSGNVSGFQPSPFSFTVGAAGVPAPPSLPPAFALSQNVPNPFRGVTQIRYALPKDSHVRITVYNVLGQRVMILADGVQTAGYRLVEWQGRNEYGQLVAPGIYFCAMEARGFTAVKKIVLLN